MAKTHKALVVDDSDDIAETWRLLNEMKAAKRAYNRQASARLLEKSGIPFNTKNNGAHLILKFGKIWANLWPGTGLWTTYTPNKIKGRGVANLIKWLQENNYKRELPQSKGEVK